MILAKVGRPEPSQLKYYLRSWCGGALIASNNYFPDGGDDDNDGGDKYKNDFAKR